MSMQEVVIADRELLQQKITRFQHAGIENVCVVSDWDRTLTRARTEAGEDTTSYLAIVHGGYLGRAYREAMDRLYAKYRPIEVSQTALENEKQDAMCEWWAHAFDLMKQFGLTEAAITEIGHRNLMRLRKGTEDFFRLLKTRDVPMYIVSAGIGNVIEAFLNARDFLTANIHVMANVLVFDHKGVVADFVEPVIHSLNKQVNKIDGTRGCVLLLGDTLEDANMVRDAEQDCVIRVGFLNEEVEKNCDVYLRAYDVIICYDGTMQYVVDLLETI